MTRTSMMLLLMLAAIGSPAMAATFEICVLVDVVTTDSGQTANGITEDKWVGANDTVATRKGAEAFVSRSGRAAGSKPSTAIRRAAASRSPWVAATDLRYACTASPPTVPGNDVRIHDAQTDTSEYYPGSTYSAPVDGSDAVGHRVQLLRPRRPSPRIAGPRSPPRPTPGIDTTTAMPTIRSPSVSPKVTAVVPGRSAATPRTTSRVTRPI